MVECQSENNDDSGIVGNTVRLNAGEHHSVTQSLLNRGIVGTKAKLDRIEEILTYLNEKAKRIAAMPHSRNNREHEPLLKGRRKCLMESDEVIVNAKLKIPGLGKNRVPTKKFQLHSLTFQVFYRLNW